MGSILNLVFDKWDDNGKPIPNLIFLNEKLNCEAIPNIEVGTPLHFFTNLGKDLVLNIIAGNEIFDVRRSNSSTSSSNFVTGNWRNIANGTTVVSTNSNTAQRVVGFYGNANYSILF